MCCNVTTVLSTNALVFMVNFARLNNYIQLGFQMFVLKLHAQFDQKDPRM